MNLRKGFPCIMAVINRQQFKGETSVAKIKKEMAEAKGFEIQVYTEDFKND